MSIARANFLNDVRGLAEASQLEAIAAGAVGAAVPPGVSVLRRGALVAALIILETFVRARTEEVLQNLSRWPARYEDLPSNFRDAAIYHALNPLQRYAAMLKRQNEDYEGAILAEIRKMSSNQGPVYGFSKFMAGDFTGNISDLAIKDLLTKFQVSDCWNTFRQLTSDIGFGVPSVHEVVKALVSKRHRSAHVSNFIPTASDVAELSADLFCVGICFDTSISASVEQALVQWRPWAEGVLKWRDAVDLYFMERKGNKIRLLKFGRAKALHILNAEHLVPAKVPRPAAGRIAVLVRKNAAALPDQWQIL